MYGLVVNAEKLPVPERFVHLHTRNVSKTDTCYLFQLLQCCNLLELWQCPCVQDQCKTSPEFRFFCQVSQIMAHHGHCPEVTETQELEYLHFDLRW